MSKSAEEWAQYCESLSSDDKHTEEGIICIHCARAYARECPKNDREKSAEEAESAISIETINVVGPVEIHHGEKMDYLHSADGLDHYFLQDGTYDGWGAAAPEGMTMEGVTWHIERIERERQIGDGETP